MNHRRFTSLIPYLFIILAATLWASSFVTLKIAFRHYHPMVVILGRMVVGSLCFLLIPGLIKKIRFDLQDLKLIGLMALFEPCLYFLFEARALELTTASQAGMITSLLPLFVSVVAFFTLGERMSQTTLLGLGVSVVGACWLSVGGEATVNAPNPPLGNLCELAAMACCAGYTIVLKKLTIKGHPPLVLASMQTFLGTLFYLPVLFFPGVPLPDHFCPGSALAVFYLGSAVTLGGYGCFNYGISKVSAGQASIFINLIPVLGLIMGMVILKERLSLEQFFACGVIFFGILLSQLGERRTAGA